MLYYKDQKPFFQKDIFIALLEAFKAYFDHAFFTLKTQSA